MPAYDGQWFSPPAPMALVALRHTETRTTVASIPMLIDCGADASLVPLAAAANIGALSASPGPTNELIGFDGSTSAAQSVVLELLFLRRAFSGKFLLIDQKWGIIGRDVLNHVAVLLDGPAPGLGRTLLPMTDHRRYTKHLGISLRNSTAPIAVTPRASTTPSDDKLVSGVNSRRPLSVTCV